MSYCLPGTCGLDRGLALLVSDLQLPEDLVADVGRFNNVRRSLTL
jgi:hypothetical protein